VLALAAERAIKRVLGIAAADFAHSRLRLRREEPSVPRHLTNCRAKKP
jgi:hypothetical protein